MVNIFKTECTADHRHSLGIIIINVICTKKIKW